jgi:hypothetical protein
MADLGEGFGLKKVGIGAAAPQDSAYCA